MKYSAAILAFASSAAAHMLLEYPAPFMTDGNGPIDDSASDFPCRPSGGAYTPSSQTPNAVKAGDKMKVSFKGGATHGGGSCQFSLTTDKEPTKESQWKVIHSIIGGCLTKEGGNLGGDASAIVADPVDVTIPEDLPEGEYTFAWSWLNKVGNREFYHNCAPLQVSGGSGGDVKSALGGLPDMFVTNIPNNKCMTNQGQVFKFPNPGKSVDTNDDPAISGDLIGDGCEEMAKMGAGNGQLGSPEAPGGGNGSSPSAVPSAAPSVVPTAAPSVGPTAVPTAAPSAGPTAVPSNPGGVFAPSASSAAPQPTGTPAPSTPETPENPPASGDCTPCDSNGAVVCIGSSQFGICNFGCAVAQDLASGMTCANGAISRRSIRRSIRRFPRAHLARHHGSNMI